MEDFRLEEIRKAQHLTRRELSEISGVHEKTINFLERKINDPQQAKLETLVKLATALHCRVRDFYPCEKHI